MDFVRIDKIYFFNALSSKQTDIDGGGNDVCEIRLHCSHLKTMKMQSSRRKCEKETQFLYGVSGKSTKTALETQIFLAHLTA